MPERKCRGLWMTAIVAMVAIFAGGGVWAAGPCLYPANEELPAGECVNLDGYDVKVVRTTTPPVGLFPSQEGGNSVFTWAITGAGAKYNVNTIDIKIPANIGSYQDLQSNIAVSICTNMPKITLRNPTGWFLFNKGIGDLTTTIGFSEFDYYVLRLVPPTNCKITPTTVNAQIKVTFMNKLLPSGLNTFFVRAGFLGQALDLLGPSLSSPSTTLANQPPLRSTESFQLGDHNCRMDITLNSDGSIANASVQPFIRNGIGECTDSQLEIKDMSITLICKNNGSGQPVAGSCKPKTFVERNIIDKSDDGSQYCYYTTKGQQVCKTI